MNEEMKIKALLEWATARKQKAKDAVKKWKKEITVDSFRAMERSEVAFSEAARERVASGLIHLAKNHSVQLVMEYIKGAKYDRILRLDRGSEFTKLMTMYEVKEWNNVESKLRKWPVTGHISHLID